MRINNNINNNERAEKNRDEDKPKRKRQPSPGGTILHEKLTAHNNDYPHAEHNSKNEEKFWQNDRERTIFF